MTTMDTAGVYIPAVMAERVAAWILTGLRADLAAERERGGPPMPAAPYLELVRRLRRAAAVSSSSANGSEPLPDPAGPLSTRATAMALGVSPRRVRQLASSGGLPARRIGRTWVIDPEGITHNGRTRIG